MTRILTRLGFAFIHDAPAHLELDGPLLRRWVLVTPLGTLRLHHLCAPDVEHHHDHPWSFLSVVVRGWYAEEFPDSSIVRRRAGSLAWRSCRVLHRIAEVSEGGAWTLVLTSPRRKSWGFLHGGSWAPWRTVVLPTETARVDADFPSHHRRPHEQAPPGASSAHGRHQQSPRLRGASSPARPSPDTATS